MSYRITLKSDKTSFCARKNESVLDAALRHQFYFPHSCRYGVCGRCKGKVTQGSVVYDGEIPSGITTEETDQNYALFCCAKPESDIIIDIPEARLPSDLPSQCIVAPIIQKNMLSESVIQLQLDLKNIAEPLSYWAGQYLMILDKDKKFPFSIANAPQAGQYIELHIRHRGKLDTQKIIDLIETGTLDIELPFGHCIFRTQNTKPILFLAEGTGFAPIKALIEEQLITASGLPMHLIWENKSEHDLYLMGLIKRWQRHIPHFSASIENKQETENQLSQLNNIQNHQCYLAGSESFVQRCVEQLKNLGVSPKNYYSDWITPLYF